MLYLNQLEHPMVPYIHNKDGGGAPEGKNNAAAAACGPCSLCMVVENMTFARLTLPECLRVSAEVGADRKLGTDLKILGPVIAERYGMEFSTTSDIDVLLAHLAVGGQAIANSGGDRDDGHVGLLSHGGHYVVVVSAENGEACILDPSLKEGKYEEEGRNGRARVVYPFVYCSLEELKDDCSNREPSFYLFKRKK